MADACDIIECLKDRLLPIIRERCYREGEFTLASGQRSTYYIDLRQLTVSTHVWTIGELLHFMMPHQYDAIGGLQAGAIPLVVAVVMTHYDRTYEHTVEGFWVREATKDHGTRNQIEGSLKQGSKVVIVDDVMSTGQSALKAARIVQAAGHEVVQVIGLVDRLMGAQELFATHGLPYQSAFTIEDIRSCTI